MRQSEHAMREHTQTQEETTTRAIEQLRTQLQNTKQRQNVLVQRETQLGEELQSERFIAQRNQHTLNENQHMLQAHQ
eukprot:1932397-Amphidinium_carterae.1